MADKQFRIVVTIDGQDYATDDLKKVNQELDKTQANARQTAQATGDTSNSFFNLKNAVTGAGLALAGAKLLDIAGDAAELGQQVRITEQRYEALASTIGDSNAILSQLRTTTLGIADDMTLQAGATDYLSRGLATNQTELNRLIELAVKLKQPTDSASDAINNFGLLLANESVLRLDSFGISGAKVRTRIEELIESGEAANRSEAFRLAVMEEGAMSLERLGDAADASGTDFERFKTRLANTAQEAAEAFSTGFVEPVSTALNDVLGLLDLVAEHGLEDVITAAQGGDVAGAHRQAAIEARARELQGTFFVQDTPGRANRQLGRTGALPLSETQALILATVQLTTEEYNLAQATANAAAESIQFANAQDRQAALAREHARTNSAEVGMLEGITDIYENLTAESLHFQSVGGIEIISREEADFATDWAGLMRTSFDELKATAEQTNFEFITEQQLADAESMVTTVEDLGDAAQDAADAFENMRLSELFGQKGGGQIAELHDMILSNIEDEDLRAQIEVAFDLESGQKTSLSQQVENEFAPLLADITEQYGTEAGTEAANRFLEAVRSGQLEGLNPVQMQEALRQAIGFERQGGTGTGEQITIQPGDTVSALASAREMTNEEFMQAAGLPSSLLLAGETITLGQDGIVVPLTIQPTGIPGSIPGTFPQEDPFADIFGTGTGETSGAASEQAEAYSAIEASSQTIADNTSETYTVMTSINDLTEPFSTLLDTLIEDMTGVEDVTQIAIDKLAEIAQLDLEARIPLTFIFNDETGLSLAENVYFQRAVQLVLEAGGFTMTTQQGPR